MIEYDVFKDGKQYALTMSFDDGSYDERLIEIFDKYGIKGTFHLNSGNMKREDYDRMGEIYKNHEISCHGLTHRSMTYVPVHSLYEEIIEDRKNLEKQAGYPVTGLSYANGKYDDNVISALRSMGIVYSRTTRSTHEFALPKDFMKWHPTCHYKECMEYGQKFIDSMTGWFGYPKLLYVWGHGHELENNGHWGLIEDFCKLVSGNEKIWYATNIEIYSYITDQRRLVIAADESMVYNPTAIKIWFSKDGTVYSINPGEF